MICHIVLFRPKPTLSEADRDALIAALRAAVTIPTIRRAAIGKRILLNRPGYETQMAEHYEYSAILEFDSEAALREYLAHPAHVDLAKRLSQVADAMLAYDFEISDPSSL